MGKVFWGVAPLVTSFIIAGCAAKAPGDQTEARLAEAASDAATSPASVAAASQFSRAAARGEDQPKARSTDLLPEISRDPSSLQPDESERVAFDAEAAPVVFADAIAAALQNDVDVAIAAERIEEAEAARINAVFGYLPRVTATGTFSRNFQKVIDTDNAVFQAGTAEFNAVSARGEIRQPIFDLGRLLQIDVADVAKTVAEQEYVGVAQASAFAAATVYLEALEAQTRIDVVERREALVDDQIAAEERLIASGISTDTGRKLLQVEKGALNVERLEYDEDLSLSLAELGRLIGQPVTKVAPVDLPTDLLESAGALPWEEYANAAYRANAELRRLRLATLESRQSYYAQFAEDFAPRVEAFGRVEYEDREASRFGGGSETRDFIIGVEATVPIFNATGEGYRNFESESQLRQAVLAEARQRRAIESETRALVTRLDAQRSNIRQADKAVMAAAGVLQDAERSLEFGLSSDILILRQKAQQLQAEGWAARSRLAFLRSWVRLSFITGDPVDLP